MDSKSLVVLILFLLYLVLFVLKAYVQFRNTGSNPFVLARGGKKRPHEWLERILFVFFVFAIAAVVFETVAGSLVGKFYSLPALEWAGAAVTAGGIGLFLAAMFSMKDSWRIGIDAGKKTRLVTSGIYSVSRNPAFTGMALMFAGLFLAYPDWITLVLLVFEITVIHLHILNEEKNLEKTLGKPYLQYKKKIPRYMFF